VSDTFRSVLEGAFAICIFMEHLKRTTCACMKKHEKVPMRSCKLRHAHVHIINNVNDDVKGLFGKREETEERQSSHMLVYCGALHEEAFMGAHVYPGICSKYTHTHSLSLSHSHTSGTVDWLPSGGAGMHTARRLDMPQT
jgi:hypothetical protein